MDARPETRRRAKELIAAIDEEILDAIHDIAECDVTELKRLAAIAEKVKELLDE
jgi:predicted transcriptional regulator